MDVLAPVVGILLLSFLCESLVEYFAAPWLKPVNSTPDAELPPRWRINRLWLRYIAAAVGVGLAFAYRTDLLALAGLTAVHPAVGYAITGIVIGRGANYLNDLVDRYLAP